MGFVLIDGYGRYRRYFKDVLDKLGVDINVFRVGEFKSAVEAYTRTDMSPEDREESRAYLNALWTRYQKAVVRGAQAARRRDRAVRQRRSPKACRPPAAMPRRWR